MEKINKVIHVIWSLNQGGAEKILLDLERENTTNYILVISRNNDFDSENKNIFYLKGNYFKKIQQILQFSKNTPVLFWMYKSICYGFPILFFRKCCGTIHHDLKYFSREKISTKISILLTLFLQKLSMCHLIYVSHASLKSHVEIGFSKSNSSVIPNGSPLIIPKNVNNLKIKQLLYVSRWDKIKNFDLAIEISKKLLEENIIDRVVFVGKEVHQRNKDLLSIITDNNLNGKIKLEGFQSNLKKFYKSSSITLISSYSESCPMALIESLSYGLPCFSTDVGDVKNIYNDNEDFIYKTATEAKEKISNYLNKTKSERDKISDTLINHHRNNYSLEAMKKKYLKLYENLFFS